jgi:hypothetical protein
MGFNSAFKGLILILYLLSYFISHRMNYICPEESLSEDTGVNRMTYVQNIGVFAGNICI